MKYLVAMIFLSLTACKTAPIPEPIIQTVEVKVPVLQPCVPETLAAKPEYVDNDSALKEAADAAVRYMLLWAGREQRMARENELETVIAGCPRGSSK